MTLFADCHSQDPFFQDVFWCMLRLQLHIDNTFFYLKFQWIFKCCGQKSQKRKKKRLFHESSFSHHYCNDGHYEANTLHILGSLTPQHSQHPIPICRNNKIVEIKFDNWPCGFCAKLQGSEWSGCVCKGVMINAYHKKTLLFGSLELWKHGSLCSCPAFQSWSLVSWHYTSNF